MFPLSDNFKDKDGICHLTAGWLNTVARMFNGLVIEMITGQDHAEIVPPSQQGDGWKFKIPSGGGLPAQPATGDYVLTSQNGVLTWVEMSEFECPEE